MDEEEKERLRKYHRDYYKKNKIKRRVINERYWMKKLISKIKQGHTLPD